MQPPTFSNPISNPNITTTQPKVENFGWIVGDVVFHSGFGLTELHVHLRNNFIIGKEEKSKAKATLDAFKFIEELIVDNSSKKDDKEGVQTLKNETQHLKLISPKNNTTIRELKIRHKNEIEALKKEVEKEKTEQKRGIEAIRAIEKDLRQYEKEHNIKANESSNSEISEFDFLQDDRNKKDENDAKEVEEE
uniref:Uncharacterized protein n=1 Tax=Meloidogyne javanica TaxID=6303 RepID=A0A915N7M9_MELJA